MLYLGHLWGHIPEFQGEQPGYCLLMGWSYSIARVAMETQIPTLRAFRDITFKTDSPFHIFLMIEAHVPPGPRTRVRSHNSIFSSYSLLYPENFNGFHKPEQPVQQNFLGCSMSVLSKTVIPRHMQNAWNFAGVTKETIFHFIHF